MSNKSASEILGNPEYTAISYGGYRGKTRSQQPSLDDLKEDLLIMHALGIRVLRTYNVQLPHASNVVKAIDELKTENPEFEMYVMLGAWIDCAGAWTDVPNHSLEDYEANKGEIQRAVELTKQYPEIIKVIAVGNEAMVHWAASYFVSPKVILNWVNHLQELKASGEIPSDLWITSSDNFASWGGGGAEYHNNDLNELIKAVDYVSLHTYPFHDTHYNPNCWKDTLDRLNDVKNDFASDSMNSLLVVEQAMSRAIEYSQGQYQQVAEYVHRIDEDKPIHIGETGWASISDGFYGPEGSRAADEYKQALFYHGMREWTHREGIGCFFFEAFDEPWKSASNPTDSENHFGLFTVKGEAKYAVWSDVDSGKFEGLQRNGNAIVKTYSGELELLERHVLIPAN
ncbi:MAG: glycosyl hydrolase family 17 protein [Flavobacteriales bacterium]